MTLTLIPVIQSSEIIDTLKQNSGPNNKVPKCAPLFDINNDIEPDKCLNTLLCRKCTKFRNVVNTFLKHGGF